MNSLISTNTQAILLLTAPLIGDRKNAQGEQLLTPGEYRRVAQRLRNLGQSPSDLLQNNSTQLITELGDVVPRDRLNRLLERGFLISQAIERWHSRAIWVLSRADSQYPKRFKTRLKDDSPPVIYGCGQAGLLDCGGLAIVGSRHVDEALVAYAKDAGQICADAKKCVVSGGAQGIDRAAMWGALEAGGGVIGVLPDGLERAALNRENRDWLLDGQLVLISPYDPSAGFNVGHAMQRNKLIYALADAALIVSADYEKGGTWAGATEQLQKLRFVTIYVRSTGEMGPGLQALTGMGAKLWPNPQNSDQILAMLEQPEPMLDAKQSQLAFKSESATPQTSTSNQEGGVFFDSEAVSCIAEDTLGSSHGIAVQESVQNPAAELIGCIREIVIRLLRRPLSEREVAKALQVSNTQARDWLQRFADEGLLEKRSKPVRYALRQEKFL